MAGKVLDLFSVLKTDTLGTEIARYWHTWNTLRTSKIADWNEVRNYIYATDTTTTTNSKLPWKNKTTIPKLCQIRDNLYSNYMASMFPRKKWLLWDADDKTSNTKGKRDAITNYMCYVISQPSYKQEMSKCVQDYIDYGNAFCMPDWEDGRVETEGGLKVGYVGPTLRRISPLDIVFNPVAASFENTPKIVRSIVSLGEVKELLESLSTSDNRVEYQELFAYLKDIRSNSNSYTGDLQTKDAFFQVDGFQSYRAYLGSNFCELLTFYGDIYDGNKDEFLKNKIITVVDKHKVVSIRDNPSYFGKAPIYHVGWRRRQDNLWAMGPLDNLVGLQYRIDHIENLKADVFDLITFPPLKIKGHVEDFEWGPFARIYVGDNDGDVEMMAPPFQVLQANIEIHNLAALMEEMAGSPKEAMGFRTPGEKTKYEVQRLENAASRIFNNKTGQLEEYFVEPGLNGLLEVGRRKTDSSILVKYFDDELKITQFLELTLDDITGGGRIKPFAARHFAEQAELVQNLTALSGSPMWQAVQPHFSTIKLAQMFEEIFNLTDYQMVLPYVALTEQADAQRMMNSQDEQVAMEAMTPSGLTPDDSTQPFTGGNSGY